MAKMDNESIKNKPADVVSPPPQVQPDYVAQQSLPHNDQVLLQTDFTSPPPTHPRGFWPQQAFPNSWETQFHMPNPMPQTKTTVTNTATSNNNTPTFSSSSKSTYRSPFPRWRSFNSGFQRTHYQYGNTPRNNYPRQFFQNANGNFFANSPQTSLSASTQNWHQFNQRPRFIPRQHNMRMNRLRNAVQNQSNGSNQETNAVTESKTRKRKLKSQQSGEPQRTPKPWNHEDAVKAIAAEMELRTPKNNQQIMIRFPDPEITRQIVQNLHPDIKSVHFHTPCNTRYCYVQISPNANIENVATALNETVFGHDKLRVEIKESQFEEKAIPECVDPYTLYLGNLPTNVTSNAVKDEFPKATRVDIGFAKKMKYTRYAFIKFANAEDAIQAYKEKYNLVIESRSVVLRFRRGKGIVNPPEQTVTLPHEQNEFFQSVEKIKEEPQEEVFDESDSAINVSRIIKSEMIEEDEYDFDSVYESEILYEHDISFKSECSDTDDEYDEHDEQYYEENNQSTVSYTFRKNENVSMDVGLADNNSAQSSQTNHSDNTIMPTIIKDDREWSLETDGKNEFKMPYSFIPKKIMLSKNYKEQALSTTDAGSDKKMGEDQKLNNSSDDANDDGHNELNNSSDDANDDGHKELNKTVKPEKQTDDYETHTETSDDISDVK